MKQLLQESFSRDWKEPLIINRLPLQESNNKIIQEGKEYPVLSKWEIPVWRLGKKNLNGRTYQESLGKRVEQTCSKLVTANLGDHPEDGSGSVKDILSISKNPHVRDGILWVDASVVDEVFDKKLNRMADAGYGLGVSSSIYGDTTDEGVVIDESVEICRFFDYVLEPSYSVFVNKSNKFTESTDKILESNNKGENTLDNKQEAMEKAFLLNVKSLIAEAENKKTISEKITSFEDISESLGDAFPDMKKSVNEKLNSFRKQALVLAEKATKVDQLSKDVELKESEKNSIKESFATLQKENTFLNEKFKNSCTTLDLLKERYLKASELLEQQTCEIGSRFTAKEYERVINDLKDVTNKIKVFESKERDYKKLVESKDKKINFLEKENISLKKNFNEKKVVCEKSDNTLNVRNDEVVERFYNQLCESDSRYKKDSIKKEILECKTELEAQVKAMHLKSKVENSFVEKFLEDNTFKDSKEIFNEGSSYEYYGGGSGFDYTKGASISNLK